jgi:hypothetical protein
MIRAEGYQGDYQSRLLEKCVRVPDPGEFILQELGMPGMCAAHEALFGRPAGAGDTPTHLARVIAEHLGFPRRPRPVGLNAVLAKVERRRPAVQLARPSEIRTVVTEIGCDLEFV